MANCCDHYPCHSGLFPGFSCEFCFCPEYYSSECSGNPKYIGEGRSKVKDCSDCLVPHHEEYVTKYYKEKRNGKGEDDSRKIIS